MIKISGFSRCFRDLIRVPRIENQVPRISENYDRVPRIRENQVPIIFLKKTLMLYKIFVDVKCFQPVYSSTVVNAN